MDDGTGESQEQSYELNQLEENIYKPIVIVMHKKDKLEQNDWYVCSFSQTGWKYMATPQCTPTP